MSDDWKERAKCRGEDVNIFFGVDIDASEEERRAWSPEPAKVICKGCPVKGMCLEYALENERYGVWGGLDARARNEMAAKRGLRIAGRSPCGTPAGYAWHLRNEPGYICQDCRAAHNWNRLMKEQKKRQKGLGLV